MNRVIERFASTYTVRQRLPGTYVDGLWKDGDFCPAIVFRASIQPASGRELLILPEGERTKEHVTIYTETFMANTDQKTAAKGDLVAYDGRQWEVQTRNNWNLNDYPHFKYLAQLVEVDTIKETQ